MKTIDYTKACMRTWADQGKMGARANAALGLAGETGEVVDLVKKHLFHDRPVDRRELLLELGDVMYYTAVLAHEFSIDLDEVMEANVAKLKARHPDGWNPGYHHQHGK